MFLSYGFLIECNGSCEFPVHSKCKNYQYSTNEAPWRSCCIDLISLWPGIIGTHAFVNLELAYLAQCPHNNHIASNQSFSPAGKPGDLLLLVRFRHCRHHHRRRHHRSANTFQNSGKIPEANFVKPHMVNLWVWENVLAPISVTFFQGHQATKAGQNLTIKWEPLIQSLQTIVRIYPVSCFSPD